MKRGGRRGLELREIPPAPGVRVIPSTLRHSSGKRRSSESSCVATSLAEEKLDRRPGELRGRNDQPLNVTPGKLFDEEFCRKAIHHEIGHMIRLGSHADADADRRWRALNPQDFQYGGDEILQALEVTGLNPFEEKPETDGFLNYYSQVNLSEDQAEVYSFLLTRSRDIEALARLDPLIARKMLEMKQRIHRFCPELDEGFLKRSRQNAMANYELP